MPILRSITANHEQVNTHVNQKNSCTNAGVDVLLKRDLSSIFIYLCVHDRTVSWHTSKKVSIYLQVVCMFPNINTKQRNHVQTFCHQWILQMDRSANVLLGKHTKQMKWKNKCKRHQPGMEIIEMEIFHS